VGCFIHAATAPSAHPSCEAIRVSEIDAGTPRFAGILFFGKPIGGGARGVEPC
jgi:hypothetical protein